VTVLVQSSSTTTSLMVPLVGTGVLKVRDIYPFTLGANIGTCITALLAATAVSGEFAVFALQIALVHLVFNIMATLFIFGIPFLREIPVKGAEMISEMAIKNKAVVGGYLMSVFVILPGAILALT
ncbi:Na/Pi cotransporter family protein, partial [Vibrio parahaemolyticus]|nr:Na/Pi cotransporter family protein [Vibrio parahaemolyticus]